MRSTRAYLAGLGTTGLLLASSILLLLVVSAIVAFNGWPGDSGGGSESVVVQVDSDSAPPGTGPAQVAADAAPAATEVAAAPLTPSADAAPGSEVRGDEREGERTPDDADRVPAPEGEERPPEQETPTETTPPPDDEDEGGDRGGGPELPGGGQLLPPGDVSLADGLGDAADSATMFLGNDLLSQLSPELGRTVTSTGAGIADLLRALDGTPAPPRR